MPDNISKQRLKKKVLIGGKTKLESFPPILKASRQVKIMSERHLKIQPQSDQKERR